MRRVRRVVGASAPMADPSASSTAVATEWRWDQASDQYRGRVLAVGAGAAGRATQAVAVTESGQVLGRALADAQGGTPVYDYFVQGRSGPAWWLHQQFPQLTRVTWLAQNDRGHLAGTGSIDGQQRAFRIECRASRS